MKKLLFLFTLVGVINFLAAQETVCYPANWFTGMKWNNIQLMIYGKNIASAKNINLLYPGIKLIKVNAVENSNYLFLDVAISPKTKAGVAKISSSVFNIDFEIKEHRIQNGKTYAQGLTGKDFMYLIMPDRFSNGDITNDRIPGMKDQSLNRDTVFNRHGGDFKGIQNHLDYLQSLGVTALWLNPVIENDMPDRTEHGYAFTNHYKIDARLGGAIGYKNLIDAAHKKGFKIIQDAVYNHVGLYHFTVQDLPMKNWLNQWPKFTQTSYKDQVIFDPNASNTDRKKMTDGWFTKQMPDLNHQNTFVANYLIQHAIWTVEEFGIDAWRIDTYSYNDLAFMNRCNKALMDEYPYIFMFGETWVHGVPNQSYFTQNNYNIPYKSNLQSTTDFQTLWGITDALTKDFGWTDGVNKLYSTLAQDFVYKNPMRQVIFLDNHDLSRFYSVVGENVNKYKCALTWLLTCRGIPQLYYGSEIATTGFTSPNDGFVRLDFPGGWPKDTINKFAIAGRTAKDQEIWQHLATLANFRKTSDALTSGKLMQFVPEDGVYVYFRYTSTQTIMVVMNTAKEERKISVDNFIERTKGFTKYKDVLTKNEGVIADFSLSSYNAVVYELIK